ncbi:MAG: hypothetical protein Q8R28_17425, partial [Dehalococcoidia bacterium]|nr:hypothetical protein [Dehalococcoidia bacterium]
MNERPFAIEGMWVVRCLKVSVVAFAMLLLLLRSAPSFAWAPDLPGAPYTGVARWEKIGSRMYLQAEQIKWSQAAIDAMAWDIRRSLDITADCREGYPDDADKLHYYTFFTNIPYIYILASDDCGSSNVFEE